MTNKKEKLWSGYFILFMVLSFIVSTVVYLLDNVLSIYANEVWGSKSGGGLLTTTFTFGAIIATSACGVVIDRTGRKRAIIVGYAMYTLGMAAMCLTSEQALVYLARVLQGVGKGVVGVSVSSAVADILPKSRMGEGMGYYGLGSTLAQAAGPSLGLALIEGGNYHLTFIVCTVCFAVCLAASFFINYEKKLGMTRSVESVSAPADARYHGVWKLFEKAALPATLVMFMYGAGCTPILIYITLYATEVLAVGNAGLFFVIAAAAMLITRFTIGRIIDKRGILGIVILGNVLGILSNIMLLIFKNDACYYICGAVYGFATAMIYPALQAAIIIDSPNDRRGAANSLMLFGLDFGILCASALFGYINEYIGWVAVFVGGGVFYAVGVVLTVLLMSNSARAKRRQKQGIA